LTSHGAPIIITSRCGGRALARYYLMIRTTAVAEITATIS
jgi:hypothetical protein